MDNSSFQIRLDLLKIVKEMVVEEYQKKCQAIDNDWAADCETSRNKDQPIPKQEKYPDFPSDEEIIKKAKKFNVFISIKH